MGFGPECLPNEQAIYLRSNCEVRQGKQCAGRAPQSLAPSLATTACGRKDVINMKCDYGCYYIASHDEAYYELATAVARGVVLSE